MYFRKGKAQVVLQLVERAGGGRFCPADQDVIPAIRRLARLRATALPTFLEQVKPTRMPSASPGARFRPCTIIPLVPCLRAFAARRKSDLCLP